MIKKGLVNKDVKISVLGMLKPIVCEEYNSHGDIKETFELNFTIWHSDFGYDKTKKSQRISWLITTSKTVKSTKLSISIAYWAIGGRLV